VRDDKKSGPNVFFFEVFLVLWSSRSVFLVLFLSSLVDNVRWGYLYAFFNCEKVISAAYVGWDG